MVWWTFILFLYLLGISLPLHLVYIAVFGVPFPYSGFVEFSFFLSTKNCGVSSLWVDGWFVKVSWLGKFVSVFWGVGLDFFSLKCNEVSSNEL